MKTKTKSTVARRRVKRRQERVSHKKLRTLRSRKYARKTAKKVMRGGEAENDGYGVLLYDEIPLSYPMKQSGFVHPTDVYRFPICVFFVTKTRSTIYDVYIFFNNNVTGDEITLTVKHFLRIDDAKTLSIEPPIKDPNPSAHILDPRKEFIYRSWHFLGDTFVKLSICNSNYCLETGVFKSGTPLFKVETTRHTMVIVDEDGKKESSPPPPSPLSFSRLFKQSDSAGHDNAFKRPEIDRTLQYLDGDKFRTKMRTSVQPKLFQKYVEQLKTLKKEVRSNPDVSWYVDNITYEPFLNWNQNDIERTKRKQNRGIDDIVPGEERLLKVVITAIRYLDKYKPEEIVENIELYLNRRNYSFTINPLEIIDDVNDAKAAAEAEAPAEAKAAVEAPAPPEAKAAAEAKAALEVTA